MGKHFLELTYEEFQKSKKSIANVVIDRYLVYEKIGQGAFGSVYRGMNDITKKQVAVKLLDLVSIEEDEKSPRVREIRKRLARTQSETMMKCNSPHVMKLFDVYQNKDLKIMIVQYCGGGTVADLLAEKGRLQEREAIDYIKQIIFGISEMHKHNIIHRDLKTQNIMFHNGVLKIVDLGFSKALPTVEIQSIDYGTTLGTIITMAPEVMKKEKYGLKADIWSIGVILYQMIYGRVPYEPMRANDMYEQIMSKNIFPQGGKIAGVKPSDEMLDFMKKILVVNQKQRMNWKQFLQHPILNKQEKQLPGQFRISRDISKIKKENYAKVDERSDKDMCDEFQFQSNQIQEQEMQGPQVSIKRITEKESQQKQKEIRKDDTEGAVFEIYLQCLKTEFIHTNIVLPIQENKLLNLKERRNVEFMYLISGRCFFNMSFISQEVIKEENELLQNLKEVVNQLYESVQKTFYAYCKILKRIQDGLGERFKDRLISIFNSQEMKEKDLFLVGVQGTDYTKEQQIFYTCDKYLPEIIKQIPSTEGEILSFLNLYKKVNLLKPNELKGKMLFERVKEMTDY